MATLRDISKHLGISVTQVSRALNGHDDVSQETRDRVLAAAEELSYTPNLTARKLVTGRSGMVGLVRRHYDTMTRDLMFLEVATGLSLEFTRLDMQFMLHVTSVQDDILTVYERLINSGSLDGFVITEPRVNDERIDYLEKNNIPFVVHGRSMLNPSYAFFDIDNLDVGYKLTKHLIDLGHKNILLLNGIEGRGYSNDRLHGYQMALEEAGISYDPDLVRHDRMTENYGLKSVIEIMNIADTKPTAVVCGHVFVAAGVYEAAKALGLKIPSDLSVVAHDDRIYGQPSEEFFPPLSVSLAPIRDSWPSLALFLKNRIEGAPLEETQEIEPIELVLRGSTAPLNY